MLASAGSGNLLSSAGRFLFILRPNAAQFGQPEKGVGNCLVEGTGGIIKFTASFLVGEQRVAGKGIQGIGGVQRRLFFQPVIQLGKTGGAFGKPHWQHGLNSAPPGDLAENFKQLADFKIPV